LLQYPFPRVISGSMYMSNAPGGLFPS